MQAIADELIRLEAVDYITDRTVCEVMKKRDQADKAFPPDEARKLAKRFEWHYTPKHGS